MAGNIKGITIEIGGDTTKLDKALKGVNSTSKDLSKQLREIDKSMKFNPKNTELVAQKQRALADAVENTKQKLETLKTAQEQAKQALAEGKIGQDQYDALTREIIKTENQLKSLQGELDKTNSKWHQAGEKMQDIGGKMTSVGKEMSTKVTAPILAIGAGAIASFKEVDNGLDIIVSKTGATGEAMEGLEKSFKNVATSIPASFEDVGNAIGEVNTQFGLVGESLEDASQKMIKFAQINGADITQSTINAKQAIEKYNLSVEDLDMVLDSVSKTAQNTGVSTDKLFDLMIKGSPSIKELNLNFAQATEMMGHLEQKGIDGQKALSYLVKGQTEFAKSGKSLTEGLSELETALASATTHEEKLAISAEIFGTKGGAFMLEALESGALSAEDFADAMEEASGTVENTFDAMRDPIDKSQQAMNALKLAGAELGGVIGSALAPVMTALTDKLKSFAEWFGNLSSTSQNFIVAIVGIAAAIGPLLVVLGVLTSSLGSIITFFAAGGAGAGILTGAITALSAVFSPLGIAIMTLIGVGILLIKHWDDVKQATTRAWNSIKGFLTSLWDGLKSKATSIWSGIKQGITTAWNGIKNITNTVWNGIKSFLESLWDELKEKVTTIWNGIKETITNAWNTIKSTTTTTWNDIKTSVETIWNGLKNKVTEVFNGIKQSITTVWNGIKSATQQTWEAVKKAIETPINKAKEIVSNAINKMKSLLSITLPFPKIKLPHFKITGNFSINPPSVPHFGVDWYDKGGIFNSPTVIGVGEKRPEFVGALDDLRFLIRDELDKKSSSSERNIIIQKMEVRNDSDIKRIAEELFKLESRNSRGKGLIRI